MPKSRTVGLIGAGMVVRSTVSALPRLAEHLGPVKASSYRVSRRIVNAIRAGEAVHELRAFADCRVILVCVEDHTLDGVLQQLAESGLALAGRTIVICDSSREASSFISMSRLGARVASIISVPGTLVSEGDVRAVREFRRSMLAANTRLVTLEPGGKPWLLAALTVAGLNSHFAAAADACLREAGLTPSQSRTMVARLMTDALRAWTKAGHQSLDRRWDDERWSAIGRQEALMRTRRPDLAACFSAVVHAAVKVVSAPEASKAAMPD